MRPDARGGTPSASSTAGSDTIPRSPNASAPGPGYLILRRLHGVTLYDAVHRGVRIPPRAIADVEHALAYARGRGLFPHDVHGRNVMVGGDGRGLVVDVSDFLAPERCTKWRDLTRAYRWLYRPVLAPLGVRVPYAVLDGARLVYRALRRDCGG
jgi:hypothetical protein